MQRKEEEKSRPVTVCQISDPDEKQRIAREILEALPDWFAVPESREAYIRDSGDFCFFAAVQDGKAVACASAASEQGYALLQNVIVHPDCRGKGLGEKLCRAVIGKAREQGARYAYLQVVQTNGAAMNLYRKLGFGKVYSYRYLKQPGC